MPDLVRLEAKYPGILVILGIHTPKFPHEKETASIRKAVVRYGIKHPVGNDANLALWKRYGVEFWPTYVLIDPEGNFRGKINGEGLYKVLDFHIGKLVQEYKGKGLKTTPFELQVVKSDSPSPLRSPGNVLADKKSDRLFISDSSNHRIVITDLAGKMVAVAGTGDEGLEDGPFARAKFRDPHGLALHGDTLYVADRGNHCIRALDLKAQTVKRIAGTGVQERLHRSRGPALTTGLNSPWGLYHHQDVLYIGMAGFHQIWALNLKTRQVGPLAGTSNENLVDGTPATACFAQPSGLGSDGTYLFVADSESSAIRVMPLNNRGVVGTLVGAGLFVFGDKDGQGPAARLQHPLDVVFHDGKLYVADTYNHKIKLLDPQTRTCTTFVGEEKGTFDEPEGLSISGGKIYVADTAAHRIRVVDLESKAVSTLELSGVPAVLSRKESGAGKK